MPTNTDNGLRLAPTADAHRELMGRIDGLHTWLAQLCALGQPRFGELGARLQALRGVLERHFTEEESGGYLSEAVAAAPRLARRALQLQAEHREFLQRLDALAEKLTDPAPPFEGWSEACDAFEDLVVRLREHESGESELARTALDEEVGDDAS